MKREETMLSKKPGHPTFKWLFRVHYQNNFLMGGFPLINSMSWQRFLILFYQWVTINTGRKKLGTKKNISKLRMKKGKRPSSRLKRKRRQKSTSRAFTRSLMKSLKTQSRKRVNLQSHSSSKTIEKGCIRPSWRQRRQQTMIRRKKRRWIRLWKERRRLRRLRRRSRKQRIERRKIRNSLFRKTKEVAKRTLLTLRRTKNLFTKRKNIKNSRMNPPDKGLRANIYKVGHNRYWGNKFK